MYLFVFLLFLFVVSFAEPVWYQNLLFATEPLAPSLQSHVITDDLYASIAMNCYSKQPYFSSFNQYSKIGVRIYKFDTMFVIAYDAELDMKTLHHGKCNITLPSNTSACINSAVINDWNTIESWILM